MCIGALAIGGCSLPEFAQLARVLNELSRYFFRDRGMKDTGPIRLTAKATSGPYGLRGCASGDATSVAMWPNVLNSFERALISASAVSRR
jgi:hypothetical protein